MLEDSEKKPFAQEKGPQALIMTPTRELAIQIKDHLQICCKYNKIKIAVVVGGISQLKQERLLNKHPEIVVATPGRLMQLIDEVYSIYKTKVHLNTAQFINYFSYNISRSSFSRKNALNLNDFSYKNI